MVRTVCAWLMLSACAAAADLAALIAPQAEVQKLAGDCQFTEGPAYSPRGYLLFSDIPNNRIVRLDADGKLTNYLKPSGQANGLVFDAGGHLYACQGEARRVVKINAVDGKLEVLAERFDGKRLNSPNDLALDGQGGLYFTDPRYGQRTDDLEQPVMGVYYVSRDGKVSRVIESLPRPNGILVSPDGKLLTVANPNVREIWQYPITGPGQLGAGKVIFTGDEQLDGGGPDGMAHDAEGRIYATYSGIVVLTADGALIGRIPVPERPANCTFGGPEGKTLYITARTSLYGLQMAVAGAPLAKDGPRPAPQVSRLPGPAAPRVARTSPTDGATGVGAARIRVPVRLVSLVQAETREVKVEDIILQTPTHWKQQEPSNRLRLAQFVIPAVEGDKEPAELVISFFGGDGGGVDANLKRWNEQFTGDDKKIKLTEGVSPQGNYYFSEVSGTYQKPVGPPIAGKKEPAPGYRSLNVILQVPSKGNYFLRLIGPDKTVKAAAAAFRASFGGDAAKEKPYEIK
jgi:gluconolactonase